MSVDGDAFLADLRRLAAGEITLEQLHETWAGRPIYIRSRQKRAQAETREAIRRDPCRDYKVVSRRYRCSVATVYNVWNDKTG